MPSLANATPMLIGVGVGPGDPQLVTLKAVEVLRAADVVLVPVTDTGNVDGGRAEQIVLAVCPEAAGRLQRVPFSMAQRSGVGTKRRESWQASADAATAAFAGGAACVAFATVGDPSVYSTFSYLAAEVRASVPGLVVELVPGISCVHALTARFAIPLNRQGRAVQITPARLIAGGLPEGVDDAVVMLDGRQTFALIEPAGIDIYWGAYLGTSDEILISGDLREVRDEIARVRAEAAERKGWMFDTYLLRRRLTDG